MAGNNSSSNYEPRSGYDLPVYGLDNGTFYYLHIPSILIIFINFVCSVTAVILSFKRQSYSLFFTQWNKSNGFVVYLAMCDGLYSVSHITDHLHVVIIKTHVRPKELCEFYGFNLIVFISAQNMMVNVMAVNAFMLMYFDKKLNFGQWDWKMLLWTFGVPFVGASISAILEQFGTSGALGRFAIICFTTVPQLIVLLVNSVLYTMTWKRIRDQAKIIEQTLGKMSVSMKGSHAAARAMSLFVGVFFIQWWPLAVYGIWDLVTLEVPQPMFHLVIIFSNIGGILNLAVYLSIRRAQRDSGKQASGQGTGSRYSTTQKPSRRGNYIDERHLQSISANADVGTTNVISDTLHEINTDL